ncbi:sulfatase [Candidatus Nitrosotenuis cloacae]|uniref:sulfatase family protein n=1 Tax=Candidatus Nitrosotenuis cloacae TaxID=1603555 RepID=UPI00227FB500|nr:sulfatase-like hydrolase/transferase [Candidatus Nitrosotenuis cloacae]
MKPNILFLTIDSLRADKFYGPTKTSKTPNIDSLIQRGTYFEQAVSSVDATDPSFGCILTGQYPFQTGIDFYKNHAKATLFFSILKEHGYNLYGMIPKKSFFETITKDFDLIDTYSIDPYALLYEGTGDRIIEKLSSKTFISPWLYFLHIMDLHPTAGKFVYPEQFADDIYGHSKYEKAISAIDVWIGKILKNINFNETLVIVTSDHGDYIPITDKRITDISNLQNTFKTIKKIFPIAEPIGLKFFILLQILIGKYREIKFKKILTPEEMRGFNKRADWYLFDDAVHIPLLLAGYGIDKGLKISQQVRHVDLLPTVLELIGADKINVDGVSLVPIINRQFQEELPAYLESATIKKESSGYVIGIRTSKYKYFRSRSDEKQHVHLYNLQDDPSEKNNIAQNEPMTVRSMERTIKDIRSQFTKTQLKKIIDKNRAKLSLQE